MAAAVAASRGTARRRGAAPPLARRRGGAAPQLRGDGAHDRITGARDLMDDLRDNRKRTPHLAGFESKLNR